MRLQTYITLGWTPILALVVDGGRKVQQVVGWEGGTGTVPATGLYVGPLGYVADIADATDLNGTIITLSSTPPVGPSVNDLWIQI